MIDGRAKALICLGGNFAVAMPDHERGFPAMGNLDLSVHVVNQAQPYPSAGGQRDLYLSVPRPHRAGSPGHRPSVHYRRRLHVDGACLSGKLKPASPLLLSEPAIVAGMAKATLPETRVDWLTLVEDYDRIRDLIEQTIRALRITTRGSAFPGLPHATAADATHLANGDGKKRCSRCSTAFTRNASGKVSTFCG